MKKRSSVELKRTFGFQKILAIACFIVAMFCFLQGLRPVEAAGYEVSALLAIPSIDLEVDVTKLSLVNHELETPDEIVGSFSHAKNKTLLIAHSTTAFSRLENIKLGDEIIYNGNKYIARDFVVLKESNINMGSLLKSEPENTIVLMTCAGELYNDGGASHRLIITATAE